MKEKTPNWFKRNSIEVILSILIVLLIVAGITNYYNTVSVINKVEATINNNTDENFDRLLDKINDSTVVVGNQNSYILQKDILKIKNEQLAIKATLEKEHNDWLAYFANFWVIIGLILGTLAIVFSFREKIRNEIAEKLSELSGVEKEFITKNLIEYKKHLNLKSNSKILVLNEKNTDLPESFKKVMKLYPNHDYIHLDNLEDVLNDENINELLTANLIIIENQVQSNLWNISNKQEIKIFNTYSNELQSEIIEENKKISDINVIPKRNIEIFKELTKRIAKKVPIIYYGGGHFPRIKDDEFQENITFANAPSQLYGNMLNMLKFKIETKS